MAQYFLSSNSTSALSLVLSLVLKYLEYLTLPPEMYNSIYTHLSCGCLCVLSMMSLHIHVWLLILEGDLILFIAWSLIVWNHQYD